MIIFALGQQVLAMIALANTHILDNKPHNSIELYSLFFRYSNNKVEPKVFFSKTLLLPTRSIISLGKSQPWVFLIVWTIGNFLPSIVFK